VVGEFRVGATAYWGAALFTKKESTASSLLRFTSDAAGQITAYCLQILHETKIVTSNLYYFVK